jgi:NTP pyrophosphatase (non-canonical NTP hydrolase)
MTDEEKVERFCADRDWDQYHAPQHLAIGLVTEAAELLDLFRFKTDAQVQAIMADAASRERVEDELSDVYFFLLRFAQLHQVDLGKALQRKLVKNEAKYPVDKARGKNLKYDQL